MRKNLVYYRIYCVLLFTITITPQLLNAEMNGSEVLERLRSYDKAFLQNATLALETNSIVNLFRPNEFKITKTVLTTKESSIAWSSQIFYTSTPSYREKTPATTIDFDENDNLLVWNVTQRGGLKEDDFQGRQKKMALLRISPEGNISEKEGAPTVEFRQPEDSVKFLDYMCLIWSSGRGFADCLDRVVEVNERDDGLINIKAYGSFSPRITGIWNITLDPKAGYLVRSALFNKAGQESAPFVFTSNGTKWIGGVSLSEESNYFFGDDKNIFKTKTERFKPETDEELLGKLRNDLRGTLPRHTVVIDFRVTPPLTYRAGRLPMSDRELLDVVADAKPLIVDTNQAASAQVRVVSEANDEPIDTNYPEQDSTGAEPNRYTNPYSIPVLAAAIVLIAAIGVFYARKRGKN